MQQQQPVNSNEDKTQVTYSTHELPHCPQVYCPQVYFCEADESHSSIQASDKCEYCNKLLCLKCKNSVKVNYYQGNSMGGNASFGRVACPDCYIIANEIGEKTTKVMIFHLFVLIIGSMIFPLLIAGIVHCYFIIYKEKETVYNKDSRKMIKMWGAIEEAEKEEEREEEKIYHDDEDEELYEMRGEQDDHIEEEYEKRSHYKKAFYEIDSDDEESGKNEEEDKDLEDDFIYKIHKEQEEETESETETEKEQDSDVMNETESESESELNNHSNEFSSDDDF